jgi:hypothetical protein
MEKRMTSPLDRLKDLSAEPADAKEFAGLKTTAAARLRDGRRPELALESRFALAYDAAHAYCLAALRYRGYRAKNRYIVFQVLPHTLGLGPEIWRVLAKCHDMRNVGEYEGALDLNERIVEDLLDACDAVREKVEALPVLP